MNLPQENFVRRMFVQRRVKLNMHRNDSVGALQRAWSYVFASYLRGDYFEFGVYQGDSLVSSYLSYQYYLEWLARRQGVSKSTEIDEFKNFRPKFHAFDTFEGMPENGEGHEVHRGSFSTSLSLVKNKCAEYGLVEPQLKTYQGLFAENDLSISSGGAVIGASIVNIDCDLYFSAKDALNAIRPFLQQGTVLLFDDYNIFSASNSRGERRALKEWLEVNGDIDVEPWFAYGPGGQSFFCHKC